MRSAANFSLHLQRHKPRLQAEHGRASLVCIACLCAVQCHLQPDVVLTGLHPPGPAAHSTLGCRRGAVAGALLNLQQMHCWLQARQQGWAAAVRNTREAVRRRWRTPEQAQEARFRLISQQLQHLPVETFQTRDELMELPLPELKVSQAALGTAGWTA